MTTIKIKNLRVRTIIGVNDWERETEQDIIINAKIKYDATAAITSDQIDQALDYKTMTKKLITAAGGQACYLIETLADHLLKVILDHPRVKEAKIEIDKPKALRYADSVSITLSSTKDD